MTHDTKHQPWTAVAVVVVALFGVLSCSILHAAEWPTRITRWPTRITAHPAVPPQDAASGTPAMDRGASPKSSDGVVPAVPPGEPARAATPAPAAGGCANGQCKVRWWRR